MQVLLELEFGFDTSGPVPERILSGLSAQRREKAQRFRHTSGAWRVVAGGVAASFLLEKHFLEFRNLQCGYAPSGKPVFIPESGISCSFSHAGNRVVALVGHGNGGVDIERHRTIDIRAGRHIFSSEEMQSLAGMAQKDQSTAFFKRWALKESLAKWMGTGISAALREFSFKEKVNGWELFGFHENVYAHLLETAPGFTLAALTPEPDLLHLTSTLELQDGEAVITEPVVPAWK